MSPSANPVKVNVELLTKHNEYTLGFKINAV